MIDVRKKDIRVKIISRSQRKFLITAALPLPEYATDIKTVLTQNKCVPQLKTFAIHILPTSL